VESRAVLQPSLCQLTFGITFHNDDARRKHQANIRIREQQPHHLLDAIRIQDVIVEEELDEIPAGHFYALIPVLRQANILFINQQPDPFIRNRADQFNSLVGRRVIDNQHLQTRVGLGQS